MTDIELTEVQEQEAQAYLRSTGIGKVKGTPPSCSCCMGVATLTIRVRNNIGHDTLYLCPACITRMQELRGIALPTGEPTAHDWEQLPQSTTDRYQWHRCRKCQAQVVEDGPLGISSIEVALNPCAGVPKP